MMKSLRSFDYVFWTLSITAIVTIAVWGYPSPAQQSIPVNRSPTASIKFLNRSKLNFPNGVESNATNGGISIEFDGIYALDRDVAFLYGQTDVGATLLRTEDRGKHWQEKIIFEPSSSVRAVVFSSAKIGWALVEYFQGEAGGPITLYGTVDAGRTWQVLSNVPTIGTYWQLVNVRFFDRQNGQIDIYQYETDPHIAILKTTDGGRTWQKIRRIESAEIDSYPRSHRSPMNRSIGRDSSYWEMEQKSNANRIFVKQRLAGENLAVVSNIPKSWGYQQNLIVPRSN